MSIWSSIADFVSELFEPAVKAIDEYIFTDQEKAEIDIKKEKIKAEIEKAKIALAGKLLEIETSLIDAQQAIIVAEARGDSWLQRNWRPGTMVLFVIILFVICMAMVFGVDFSGYEYIIDRLFDTIILGLSGYLGLRTVEKVSDVIKKNKAMSLLKKLNAIDRLKPDIKKK